MKPCHLSAIQTPLRILAVLVLFVRAETSHAGRNEIVRGPVEATVLSVTDGDTLFAEARIWPGHTVRVHLRVRGIDAPEMKSRCPSERAAALAARAALKRLIAGMPIEIFNIGGGKYYGRVLADVRTRDGAEVAGVMLSHALVRPYSGGKRLSWCG